LVDRLLVDRLLVTVLNSLQEFSRLSEAVIK